VESDKHPLKDLNTATNMKIDAPEYTPVVTNQIVPKIPVLPVLET
jgi:hypothetical protein